MDQLRYWMENSPLSVPVCVAALISLYFLARFLKVTARKAKRAMYYQIADQQKLQIIEEIRPSGADIPRIGGAFMGRQVDLSGIEKSFPPAGMITLTRITMPHNIYLVKSVHIEYNPAKKPPLQKVLLDGKEQNIEDLRSIEAFDSRSVKFLQGFLEYYCRGKSHANCVIDFVTGKASFDRDASLLNDSKHLTDSMTDFARLIHYSEKLSRNKEEVPLKSDNF